MEGSNIDCRVILLILMSRLSLSASISIEGGAAPYLKFTHIGILGQGLSIVCSHRLCRIFVKKSLAFPHASPYTARYETQTQEGRGDGDGDVDLCLR